MSQLDVDTMIETLSRYGGNTFRVKVLKTRKSALLPRLFEGMKDTFSKQNSDL